MLDWLRTNDVLLWWPFALSVAMFLAGMVLAPLIVVRLPANYFAARRPPPPEVLRHPVLKHLWHAARNVFGLLLVLAGLAMLVVPGQGLMTILIGVSVMVFPGKYRLQRWLIHQGPVLRSINALRRHYGRPPLE